MTKLTLPQNIFKEFILHLITKTFFLIARSKISNCKEIVKRSCGIFPQEGWLSEVWRFYPVKHYTEEYQSTRLSIFFKKIK